MAAARSAALIFIVILALALLGAGTVAVVDHYAYESRGVAYGRSLPPVLMANEIPYGVNVDFASRDEAAVRESLELLAEGGFRWLRQPFHWQDVEPGRGVLNWGAWDKIIDLYHAHGFRVIAVLDQPPSWARQEAGFPNSPPKDFGEYASFVAAFAERYRGKIDHLQIWDEPNIHPNWGNRAIDPGAYSTLLREASAKAKAANPDCVVLTAGLAPNIEPGGANMSDVLFLREMYRHGARGSFDVLAAEPYGMALSPVDRTVDGTLLNFSRVQALRQVMVENGDERTAVWAVEFGWNALPAGWSGRPTIWGAVSEDEQAEFTARALVRARDEWPWMGVMCVQGFLPWVARDDPSYGFSIVDWSRQPRPVFHAIKALAAAEQFAGVGWHQVRDPRFQWEGEWTESAGRRIGSVGSRLVVPFQGTGLYALVERGPSGARLLMSVDGDPPHIAGGVGGSGPLDLHASQPRTEWVRLADGLADGGHRIEIEVAPSPARPDAQQAVIEAFMVVRERSRLRYFMALVASLGASVFLLHRLAWLLRQPASLALMTRLTKRVEALVERATGTWAGLAPTTRDAVVMLLGGGAVAVACLSANLGVVAVAGLVVLGVTWWRLDLGLALLAFAIPFYLVPFKIVSASTRPVFSPLEALTLACLASYIGRRFWPRRADTGLHFRLTSQDLAVGLFVAAAAVSVLVAESPREALRELRTTVLEPVIVYYLLMTSARERALPRLVNALILGGAAVSLLGLCQYFFTDDVITAEGVRRMKALYGSPNNLSLYLGRIIPLAGCLALWSGNRGFYLAAVAVMVPALILTFSLGGWVAVAITALVVAGVRGRRTLLAAAASGLAALLVLFPILKVERIASHLSLSEGTTTALRMDIWRAALTMIGDHPVLGVGLDQFLVHYPRYMLPSAWREPHLSHPHNLLLDFWLRIGIAGLAAVVWLLGSFFAMGFRLYQQENRPWQKALVLGLLASMLDFVVHGMIDNSYFVVDLAVIFWLSMALVRILDRERGLA
ncbi:MAG: O-antigen ligase family protein [Chloroflexota bacterium]